MSEITKLPLWARIDGGRVAELYRTDTVEGRFAPEIVWAQVPERLEPYVDEFYRYVGGRLEPQSNGYFLSQIANEVAQTRWAHQILSVWYDNKRYHSDSVSTGNYTGAIIQGQEFEKKNGVGSYSKTWKTDGTGYVVLTLENLITIGSMVADYIDSCFVREAQIMAAVGSKTDLTMDYSPLPQPIPWNEMLDAYEREIQTWPKRGDEPAEGTPSPTSRATATDDDAATTAEA